MSKNHFCRVCGLYLGDSPQLTFEDLPQSAQKLPDETNLDKDLPITLVVVECAGCGVVQTLNRAVPYFREVIRASGFSAEMRAHRLQQFTRFIDKFQLEGRKVLEIGCGRGENLEILARLNVKPSGIEFGKDAITFLRGTKLCVTEMFFENGQEIVPDGPFNGFFFFNFLEHVLEPRVMLLGIRRNLIDDAVGLIEVPNFDMILEKSLYTEFIADHLFYFSKKSLENTLRSNGFEVLECAETWHRYTLTAVVRKRSSVDFSHMEALKDELGVRLKIFFDEYPRDRVAIWGAGHQALTVMAMAGLKSRVRYVVDSAPFKQGRYTPGTHIPIVSPATFFEDSLSAVLVIAGSYTNEVCEEIRSNVSRKMTIAVLESQEIKVIEG